MTLSQTLCYLQFKEATHLSEMHAVLGLVKHSHAIDRLMDQDMWCLVSGAW